MGATIGAYAFASIGGANNNENNDMNNINNEDYDESEQCKQNDDTRKITEEINNHINEITNKKFKEYTYETRHEWLKEYYSGFTEKDLVDNFHLSIEDLVTKRIDPDDLWRMNPRAYFRIATTNQLKELEG